MARIFQVLNTPSERRQVTLDQELARFPHVNGDLFAEALRIPDFDPEMRRLLLEAGRFDWTAISPAIFGALFQSVLAPADRRAQGAHYTTEKNILKVIGPLFLDDLRAEFKRLQTRQGSRGKADLERFRDKLGALRLLDPACGCGNFLIIAYRELRVLEIEVLRELASRMDAAQLALDVRSVVDVDQFYGIEIGEFPARIASTALWMMDHIMNNELSLEFGKAYARIPIEKSPHIRDADALEIDWADVLPPDECSYVLGNPPFAGAKYQSKEQRAQVRRIAALGGSGGTLDYVAAWFIRAGEYVRRARPAGAARPPRIGFVATNSITQGEQAAQLWPLLLDHRRLEIAFAHRTFAWGSDARGKAHVHVVIIGLDAAEHVPRDRRLFAYEDLNGEPLESLHGAITPYLFDAGSLANPHLVVREEARAINEMPQLIIGSKPIDGGHYILDRAERADLLEACPDAAPHVRPYVGSREYINGIERWILWLGGARPELLRQAQMLRDRVAAVRKYREGSTSPQTRELAETPTLYHVNVVPESAFLVIPEVSSERRNYVPIGWLEPPVIPSNLVRVLWNATKPVFALLTSAMHMAWLRHIGGRMKSDYRYSIRLVYNTFPLPPAWTAKAETLVPHADAVLSARASYSGATPADLYDPDATPPDLRKAHRALDRAVDRLYRQKRFSSERERVEHLFTLYERMRAPLEAAGRPKRKRRRRVRVK